MSNPINIAFPGPPVTPFSALHLVNSPLGVAYFGYRSMPTNPVFTTVTGRAATPRPIQPSNSPPSPVFRYPALPPLSPSPTVKGYGRLTRHDRRKPAPIT